MYVLLRIVFFKTVNASVVPTDKILKHFWFMKKVDAEAVILEVRFATDNLSFFSRQKTFEVLF